jgi:hypothetical protein
MQNSPTPPGPGHAVPTPATTAARAGSNPHGQGRASARDAHLIPDLRPGEHVIVLLRRHPMVIVRSALLPTILLVLWLASLVVVIPFLASLQVDPLINPSAPPSWLAPVLWVGWLVVLGVLFLWIAYAVLDWREDWIALTSRRVIIMDKTLFLRESRREAPVGKVQNVIAEYPNALGMAFDFGDLRVDTAGMGTLSFPDMPHPKAMREAIFAQQKVQQSAQPPPEDRRQAVVKEIILGQDPSTATRDPDRGRNQTASPFVTGYGALNAFFPLAPQRHGARVTWHKHWALLLRGLLLPLMLYSAALVAWFVSIVLTPAGTLNTVEVILGWVALVLTPVCLIWALWNWEDWRNDVYRLDHERVYHIESLPFGLREQSKETMIGRISDVMYVVPGPIANLLNYGDVVIKTPGEATEFVFGGIPCPREVQQEIMERVDDARLKAAAGTDREIEAWIKAYHDATRNP